MRSVLEEKADLNSRLEKVQETVMFKRASDAKQFKRNQNVQINKVIYRDTLAKHDYLTNQVQGKHFRDSKALKPFNYTKLVLPIKNKSKVMSTANTFLSHLEDSPVKGQQVTHGALSRMKQRAETMRKDLHSQLDAIVLHMIKMRDQSYVCEKI
jgi:hypothetical protein